jgi:hypothetical protein
VARIGLVALAAGLVLAAAPAQAFGAGRVAGLTVSPQPGTPDASPTTQISLLGVPASRILNVRVRGARSGLHRGRLRPYSSGDGASFVPGHRFSQGEVVSVRVTASSVSGRQRHGLFRFRVGGHADLVMPPGPAPPSTPKGAHSYVSRPDLHPPVMSITARRDGRAAGDLFVSTILAPGHRPPIHGQIGPMIFDDQGEPVWVSPSPARREAFTFRVQTYRGSPVLTWWQGRLSFLGLGFGENVIADSTYRVLARVRAGNGYHADLHEFTIDDRDSGWVTIYVPVLVRFGGRRVPVLDSIVQRVDIPTGLVMFEWHSLGNIGLRESYVKRPKGRLPWDAFHVNSIELDRSGNLLLSERNTWAVYKVSGRTGRILWRLGGKRSNFRLSRHARFAWQHDAHRQADGTITIFDDEAAPRAGHESRGITLSLHGHRARLARSYINRRHLLAGSQGNMQVLPGGNVLVGWGAKPYLSEYSPNGRHLLFEARFPRGDESYRAYRFDWVGRPTTLPAVAARLRGGKLTVYASWNGATEVASWRVLAGGAPDALQPAAVAARSGFETKVPVAGPGPYVAVEALDAAGRVLGTSATVKGT